MNPIPVFMYHHINQHKDDIVTITPEAFEAQMRFLTEQGYRTVSADEVVEFADPSSPLPSPPYQRGLGGCGERGAVAITFDDGYLDNYIYAFPILKKYNIKAIIFLIVDWVEKASKGMGQRAEGEGQELVAPSHSEGKELIANGHANKVMMNWDMVLEMQNSGLVDFYSHTTTHRKCAELSEEELTKELNDSKRIIEERLNRPCPYLCWPKGSYNENSVKIAKEAGYKALWTTIRGVVKTGSDKFFIERIVVKDDIGWFKNRVRIYTNNLFSKIYLAMRGNE